MRRRMVSLAAVAALAGCTVGPVYVPPADAPPPGFVETSPAGEPGDLAAWWTRFGDRELDRLVQIALNQSLDVQTAVSRVRQARLGITVARAQGLPQLNARAQAQRSYPHEHVDLDTEAIDRAIGSAFGGDGIDIPSRIDLPGVPADNWSAGLDASWQVDVFGGIRRSVEAAHARADAAEWDLRDARLTIAAEVADDYMQLRASQLQEAIAVAEVRRQSRSLEILANTAKAGLVPQGDFTRQRAQLAATQASLPPIIAQERIMIHALGVLLAQAPASLDPELKFARPDPALPPAVPPGLPSALLRRRPDIRAAERTLAAATADIGVAVADLYPKFSLTGALQLMSMDIGSIATVAGRTGSGAGAVTFPILDWGRRRATVKVREEDRQQAYLAYQRAVLGALRDVEDALARTATERDRHAALANGVADAERSVRSVQARSIAGLANLNDVLDAQAQVLSLRNQLASSDGALRRDLVALYRALGGGWEQPGDSAAP